MKSPLPAFASASHRLRLGAFALVVAAGLGASGRGADAAKAPATQPVTFAQLASCPLFTADRPAPLPAAIDAARDRSVVVVGYMLPLSGEEGRSREFLLMRNQNACCFGRMPEANEYLLVRAADGVAIHMDTPVAIEGTLRIEPIVDRDSFVQFYRLDEARLATAAR